MEGAESAEVAAADGGEVELDGKEAHEEEGVYEDEYGGAYAIPADEFSPVNSVECDGGVKKNRDPGVTAVAFDSHEELLWVGTKSGHVTSYYGTQMQKYTSFQIHPRDEIRNLVTLEHSILALTNTSLRMQIRRGIPCFTHNSDNMTDMHSLLYNSRSGKALIGGMQDKLIELDLATVKETRVVSASGASTPQSSEGDLRGTCAILRDHSRYICCGDALAGKVALRDPRSLKIQHTLDTHSGALSDFDVHGHLLVTCGQSSRHGIAQADRFLMVYDLRIMRAVSPIQAMVPPFQLRFLPALSSRIAVLSSMGQVQLVDTAALTTPNVSIFQVNMPMEGCSTISMDISPSNQCLGFGDNVNYVHLYSSVPDPVLNPFARETEFADEVEHLPPMSMEDPLVVLSSVPRPNLPPGQTTYLSDYWPERFARTDVFRPTPEVDPEILRTMKIVGTVGYARNVGNVRRNQVNYPNVKVSRDAADRLRRGGGVSGDHGGIGAGDGAASSANGAGLGGDQGSGGGGGGAAGLAPGNFLIPKAYRKVAIKLSKMGADDFDFDRYNRTGFCGLEASLPNSYCNAMLQILFFTEQLRMLMLNHTCDRENCLCCELSFLFHMMDISPGASGVPCHSGNFLRALRTIPEASALGLVFTDQTSVWNANVPRLVQSWNRFILHQLSHQINPKESPSGETYKSGKSKQQQQQQQQPEASSSGSSAAATKEKQPNDVEAMYGMRQEKANTCCKCKTVVKATDTVLLCNLLYPENKDVETSFESVVCSSLCPDQTTPAWCEKCRKYQSTVQSRTLGTLPFVLSLNAGMDNQQDIDFWNAQMQILYNKHKPPEEDEDASDKAEDADDLAAAAAQQQPPPNVKPCRYGLGCSRPDCKFWHPQQQGQRGGQQQGQQQGGGLHDSAGDRLARLGLSWVPQEMELALMPDGKARAAADVGDQERDQVVDTRKYKLFAVSSAILDPNTGKALNVVASVNVGPFYHSRIASPVSQWYVINDFSINMVMPGDAVWFNLNWKIPCVFFYVTEETKTPERLADLKFSNPITEVVFKEDVSLANANRGHKRITFTPLSQGEMPRSGDLVAIDAEFVTLNQEESELRSDGKVSTIKAAQMSVARITCVRGSGPNEGKPFIDDYISTQEQVVDYVTKFSGIQPGDLDANFSSKHLTTLKSTYKKLRYLVDTGCVFIGHGLKNDFKVINLVVPAEQVMDTVHLFHLPHNRMVSLKFLAWHFLGLKIQSVTHDSVEDAVTALRLYRRYLKLKEDGTFIEELNGLYEKGKACNWKIPDAD